MAKVTLSKEAQRDIIAIRNYIRDELCNPSAAKHIIACLKKSIQSLEKFSGRGRPLDALLSVHTEYRYLVCENYCIFYLEDNERVIIVRILHQRQDSLRALFLEKFYRFSDYLGTTPQMSELLGLSSISGILRFGRYPAYHGISEPHLAVKSSKTVVENRPYY